MYGERTDLEVINKQTMNIAPATAKQYENVKSYLSVQAGKTQITVLS